MVLLLMELISPPGGQPWAGGMEGTGKELAPDMGAPGRPASHRHSFLTGPAAQKGKTGGRRGVPAPSLQETAAMGGNGTCQVRASRLGGSPSWARGGGREGLFVEKGSKPALSHLFSL